MDDKRKKLGIHQRSIPVVSVVYAKDDHTHIAEQEHARAEAEHARAERAEAELDEQRPRTLEDHVRKFKRLHARNPRLTAKEYCQGANVNYPSFRVVKYRYEKRQRRR